MAKRVDSGGASGRKRIFVLIFIDESGNYGVKPGSGHALVFAAVVFTEPKEAEAAKAALRQYLKARKNAVKEFKFSAAKDSSRDKFFEVFEGIDYRVYASVCDKRTLSMQQKEDMPAICGDMIEGIVNRAASKEDAVKITADSMPANIIKGIKAKVRRINEQGGNVQLRVRKSHQEELIQMADFYAGAIARPFNSPDKNNAMRWIAMAVKAGKIGCIEEYGKEVAPLPSPEASPEQALQKRAISE